MMVEPPVIIKREEWGAQSTGAGTQLSHPIGLLIEDFMPFVLPEGEENLRAVDECETQEDCMQRMRDLQKTAFQQQHPDIKYNFLIGGDGQIYEGRGWDINTNDTHPELLSYSIGYIGNFFPVDVQLPPKILEAKEHLIKYAQQQKLLKEKYINWTLKDRGYKMPNTYDDDHIHNDSEEIKKHIEAMSTETDLDKKEPGKITFVDTEPEEEPQ